MPRVNRRSPKHDSIKYGFAAALVGTLVPSTVRPGEKSKCTNWFKSAGGRHAILVLEDGSRVLREVPGVKGGK